MEPRSSAAKLIIAWGANVLGTNVHLWPFIVEARRNGAKFVVNRPHPDADSQSRGPAGTGSSREAISHWRSHDARDPCRRPP